VVLVAFLLSFTDRQRIPVVSAAGEEMGGVPV
jgi:hypothetical protein